MHAEKSLEKIYRSYDKYYRKMSIAKNNVDMFYKMKNAREEGKEQGRVDEKLQIARNALAKGLPVEVVIDITGLSLDEIEKL
jgi:predicted transposase/invertase (TIGR01784 family)